MDFNIENINTSELNLSLSYYLVNELVEDKLRNEQYIDDELLAWIINSPPIYASAQDDEQFESIMKEKAINYLSKQKDSIGFVNLIRKHFYEFLCTDSEKYAELKLAQHKNINELITSLSGIISASIGTHYFGDLTKGSLIGIITSLVVIYFKIAFSISKNAYCEHLHQRIID